MAWLGTGCVERSRELTRTEREQLRQYVSDTATSPQHELDISFEDKIKLVGYDLSAESWRPGSEVTITWHWKVERALEDGWNLFTHVSDGRDGSRLNEDNTGVVRELYPPGRWKAGETIKDPQAITLPEDWGADQAIFYIGLWNGPHRLRVTRGANDGDNRARAASVPVRADGGGETPREPDVPSLEATRVEAGAIELDGRLDEPAWRSARSTGNFVNTMNGSAASFETSAKVLFGPEHLYVGFEVADDYLKSEFTGRDDHLWQADCVEIMVDPDGDGRNYFELQVNPRNAAFDTRYDRRRVPGPHGHVDWDSGIRSGVQVRGTIDDDDDDEGYTVEIAIPWTGFVDGDAPGAAPSAGDEWRINFYVMDSREEGQRAAGWSPPRVGDFHVPNRFGKVSFGPRSAAAAAGTMAAAPLGNRPLLRALPGTVQRNLQTGERAQQARRRSATDRDTRRGDEPILGLPEGAMVPTMATEMR